jgi:rhodanese-related sulfurtransferase
MNRHRESILAGWIAGAIVLGLVLGGCSTPSIVGAVDEAVPPLAVISEAQLEIRPGLVLAGPLDVEALAAADVKDLLIIDQATLAIIDGLLEANANRSVVMHCGTGNRAAMIWAALQMNQGQTADAVLASVGPLVTREPVEAAIRAYGGGVVEDGK